MSKTSEMYFLSRGLQGRLPSGDQTLVVLFHSLGLFLSLCNGGDPIDACWVCHRPQIYERRRSQEACEDWVVKQVLFDVVVSAE